VELLYTKAQSSVSRQIYPLRSKECIMSLHQPLSPEQEAQAQELLARIREQADEELLALARLLVGKEDRELFGETEFEVRDIVHRVGAKAYTAHLAKKKTATRARASSAPIAGKAPNSTAGATKQP
jgi:hypothetical protein